MEGFHPPHVALAISLEPSFTATYQLVRDPHKGGLAGTTNLAYSF
jgi:hypothetical protein